MKKFHILLPFIVIIIGENSFSQAIENSSAETDLFNLDNKQSISVQIGFQMIDSEAELLVLSDGSSVNTNTNISGAIEYQYWMNERSSVNLSAGIFSVETNTSFSNVETSTILSLLFGSSIYPTALTLGKSGRIYLGAKVGMYIGRSSGVSISSDNLRVGTITETVFGAEPYVGLDFFAAQKWRFGPRISYHHLGSFEEIGGGDYVGPSFSFIVGLLF